MADELLVGYVAGASETDRSRARSRAQGRLAERVVRAADDRGEVERVVLPYGRDRGQAIAALHSDPKVRYAEPNWLVRRAGEQTPPPAFTPAPLARTASDPFYRDGSTWGLRGGFGSGADLAWRSTTGKFDTYIGVTDEGIQFDHADLRGQIWTNPLDPVNGTDDDRNGHVDDVHGWDFANDDATVYDGGPEGELDNHGTHVAGTINAAHDRVGVPGVANGRVQLISGKFLGAGGTGSVADAVQAVDYFTALKQRGVRIVATNNSWTGGGHSQALLEAIGRGAREQILFIAAAGNNGANNDRQPSYPSGYSTTKKAGYEAVIAVAAIDERGALAPFSQYGATTVDLGAPGVDILSTTAYGYGYDIYSGTSMATPHVSGAAALYASTRATATAIEIRDAILSGARATPTGSLSGKTETGGRLNVSGF